MRVTDGYQGESSCSSCQIRAAAYGISTNVRFPIAPVRCAIDVSTVTTISRFSITAAVSLILVIQESSRSTFLTSSHRIRCRWALAVRDNSVSALYYVTPQLHRYRLIDGPWAPAPTPPCTDASLDRTPPVGFQLSATRSVGTQISRCTESFYSLSI